MGKNKYRNRHTEVARIASTMEGERIIERNIYEGRGGSGKKKESNAKEKLRNEGKSQRGQVEQVSEEEGQETKIWEENDRENRGYSKHEGS